MIVNGGLLFYNGIKGNFILKGGLLISSMIGGGARTTMDMDTTVRGIQLEKDKIVKKFLSFY